MVCNRSFRLTSIAVLCLGISAYSTANTGVNSGTLSQEVNQSYSQPITKPTGNLFDNQAEKSPTSTGQQTTFRLQKLTINTLDGAKIQENVTAITDKFLNKDVSFDDLTKLTQELTQFYRQNNFLVAKAFLPPQEIKNGEVKITVVKGDLGNTEIQNQSHLRTSLIERITKTQLNGVRHIQRTDLERLALILNDIQGVATGLSLKAGKETGKTDVTLSFEDKKRFGGYFLVDNQGNKSTGRYRGTLGLYATNLLGFGDQLKADILSSNNADLNSVKLDYSALINGYATRLGVTGSYLRYALGGNFKDLNAEGASQNIGVYLQHPTIRRGDLRLNTKVFFNHNRLSDKQKAVDLVEKRNINTAGIALSGSWNSLKNGVSYFSTSLTTGKEKGHSRSAQDEQSTSNRFTVFNYSLSHEQNVLPTLALNLGVSGQFTDGNLESSNKMLLGGLYAVRGYAAGAASVDEGHVLQAEIKHFTPLFKNSLLTSSVFYDYGFGKYYKNTAGLAQSVENNAKLQSAGVALSLAEANNYTINATFAKPINNKIENADKYQLWLSAVKTF